jgi:sugar/nucleoside kinase (ribokinase family)
MCQFLRSKGVRVGGVTMGEHGLVWIDERGEIQHLPALAIPKEQVIDTNGAGDIFHGAYVFSYLKSPQAPWEQHFRLARAASAHSVHNLGIEESLPTLADVEAVEQRYREAPSAAA